MAILLYFIMLLYFVSYYLYSNVYGFTLFVSYIMLSHHWLGYISQILVFKPNIVLLLFIFKIHIYFIGICDDIVNTLVILSF